MKIKRLFLLGCFLTVFGMTGVSSAALLGDDLGFPLIAFDSQGTLSYNAISDLFSVEARPVAIRLPPPSNPIPISSGIFLINAEVNARQRSFARARHAAAGATNRRMTG